jgi:DNA-binding NtrC family response regulator
VVLRRLLGDAGAAELVSASLGDTLPACEDRSGETYAGTLEEIERRAVRAAFEEEGRNVSRTAKRLGVDRQTLRKKLGACGDSPE